MRNPGIVARCAALAGIDPRSGKKEVKVFPWPAPCEGRTRACEIVPTGVHLAAPSP